ncbi:MAG: SDR family oxidoreductase [Pseudomonadota bacterium]
MTEPLTGAALITGASRGIGRAIALRTAALGLDVFLLARDEQALASVAQECRAHGVHAASLAGPLTDAGYREQAVRAAEEAFGAPTVLINNAGTASAQPVQSADLAAWQDVMALNFEAAVALCRAVLPAMIDARRGTIINISSISGRTAGAGSAIYSASKFALNGFSEAMFEDVRDHGIKVSAILPGFVETDLTGSLGLNNGHMIAASDVADSVAYVLQASPRCCPTEIVLRPQHRP